MRRLLGQAFLAAQALAACEARIRGRAMSQDLSVPAVEGALGWGDEDLLHTAPPQEAPLTRDAGGPSTLEAIANGTWQAPEPTDVLDPLDPLGGALQTPPGEVTAPEAVEAPAESVAAPLREEVEAAPAERTVAADNASECVTRLDPRIEMPALLLYRLQAAPEGTPCIFGVVDKDEGSHCVHDDGKHGSFGWCYTKRDKTQWGSCSESCPLFGTATIFAHRIEHVEQRLEDLIALLKGAEEAPGAPPPSPVGSSVAAELDDRPVAA